MIRKTLKILGRACLVLVIALFIGVCLLAWRLSEGPIKADFLRPRLEAALSDSQRGYRVTIAETEIAWRGWQKGLSLRAVGVKMIRRDHTTLARLPALAVKINAGALAIGRLRPTEISLIRPRLHVARLVDGRLDLRLDSPKTESASPALKKLLGFLSRPGRSDGALLSLRRLFIEDASLIVTDANLGRTWKTENFSGLMTRDADGRVRGAVSLDLKVGARTVKLHATGIYQQQQKVLRFSLRFKNLGPDLFASAKGYLRALKWFDVPLSGQITVRLFPNGRLTASDFTILGKEGRINVPGYLAKPLTVRGIKAKGRLSTNGNLLTLDLFRADLGGPVLTVKGRAFRQGKGPIFDGSADFTKMSARDLGNLWPKSVVPNGRLWVVRNIRAGTIDHLRLRLRIAAPARPGDGPELDLLTGDFSYSDLTVGFLKGFPAVTKATGTARLDEDGFYFAVYAGNLAGVRLRAAKVVLNGFYDGTKALHIDASLDGKIPVLLRAVDHKPLALASRIGISPLAVKGDARGRFKLFMELGGPVPPDAINIQTRANLKNVFWRKGVFGFDLTKASLVMDIDQQHMRLRGKGLLGTYPATLDWDERFGKKVKQRRRFRLNSRFDPKSLARVGIDIRHFMRGSFGAVLDIRGFSNGRNIIDGRYDFRQTSFTVPGLNLTKKAGQRGQGQSRIIVQGNKVQRVPFFRLRTAVISADGSAAFHRDGSTIKQLNIRRLVAGKSRLSARISGTAAGVKNINLKAEAFDLAPVLAARTGTGRFRLLPMRVSGSIGRLYLSDKRFVMNVRGDARYDGNQWRRLVVVSDVPGGRPFSIRLTEKNGYRLLSVRTQNAGAALRAMNLAETIDGGRVSLTAQARLANSAAPITYIGRLEGGGFKLRRAPVSGQVLKQSSFDKLARRAAGTEGLTFRKIVLPFRYRAGKITLKNGRVTSADIGVTLNGTMDYRQDMADIQGTIVPAYTLNSLLGGVPLIGRLLVGEKNSGVFAARYRVVGKARNPKVSVNMLSVLTPGFTRGLFDIFTGKADQQSARNPLTDNPAPVEAAPYSGEGYR